MLVILSGVSGAGKDTIKKELMQRMPNIVTLPSFTSRELMGNKIKEGKIIVKDIEVNGTENLLKILGNDTRIVTIFLKVEKEELKRRLIERGDNIQDIKVRLGRLDYEESKINLYDYVLKNDEFEKIVQVIMTIIENEKRIEDSMKK